MNTIRLRALLRLFRIELPFAAGVCVVLGQMLALGNRPTLTEAALGFLGVFCVSAAALIVNDYFDLESDRINAPDRPLPAGLVTERDVLLLFTIVTLVGFAAGFFLGWPALAVLAGVWGVGLLYNWRLKRTGLPGNLMVSFSVGMTFVYGGVVVGKPFEPVVLLFALLVSLINLGEEIAADAMDMVGDRHAGSRSLAVRLGPEGALKVSASIFFVVVVVSVLPFMFGRLEWVLFVPIAFMDAVIVYSTVRLLDARITNRRTYIRRIYLSGTVALIIIVAMRMVR